MKILVNSWEMKQCDRNTICHFKVPSLVLMERAAIGVVEAIETFEVDCSKTLIVCGMGNNGGDGAALARLIRQKGWEAVILLAGREEDASKEMKQQLAIARQYQIPILTEMPKETYTLVVDALFGIGLSREVTGEFRTLIEEMNQMKGEKLAIDIPSGISADDGQVLGCGFLADLTVTFAYLKTGLILYPGCTYAGHVEVKDIGIDKNSWMQQEPSLYAFEPKDLSLLPKRRPRTNKGSYGHVLVIAGQPGMSGAAFFSGKAAAVTGCGLVKIMTAEENRSILQQQLPEAVLDTWEKETSKNHIWAKLERNLRWADAVVIGPGLGTGEMAAMLLRAVLHMAVSPLVIDADALNILSGNLELLSSFSGTAIVTPHLGEMARLTGQPVEELQKDLLGNGIMFAREYDVICVLKDAKTVTALPDGASYINTSGNNGMATAGSGDVLTGVLAGLLAQGLEGDLAAPLGVYLHGLAGDDARKKTGCYGMLATDIIEGIRSVTKDA